MGQYEGCVQMIEDAGFELIERVARANAARKNLVTSEDHIFTR